MLTVNVKSYSDPKIQFLLEKIFCNTKLDIQFNCSYLITNIEKFELINKISEDFKKRFAKYILSENEDAYFEFTSWCEDYITALWLVEELAS